MKTKKKTAQRPVAKRAKKGGVKPETVDDYLAQIPEPGRSTLNKVRASIKAAAPREATEVISYGMPALKHEAVLLWFAAFADHCSLFPTGAMIEQFKSELLGYTLSKGTIQFPLNKPLPASLVEKIVRARVAYIADKAHR